MVVACHCEGRGWKFWADSNLKGKFWGRSIQLDPVGVLSLQFEDGETFQWSKVTTSIYNIILGKIYCDHYGTMRISGSGNYSCKLKFKEQSIIDRNPHQVSLVIAKGRITGTIYCSKHFIIFPPIGVLHESIFLSALHGKTYMFEVSSLKEFTTSECQGRSQ